MALPGLMMPPGLMGGKPPATIAYQTHTNNPDNLSTYTFSNPALATAASAGGDFIVNVVGRSTSARTVGNLTIGGVSASQASFISAFVGKDYSTAGIYIARIPPATSGNVQVAWSGTMTRCAIGLYRAQNLISLVQHDFKTDFGGSPSGTLNIPAGGIAVGVAYVGGGGSISWSGLTRDYEEKFESNQATHSGASASFQEKVVDYPISVTETGDSEALALASFR